MRWWSISSCAVPAGWQASTLPQISMTLKITVHQGQAHDEAGRGWEFLADTAI